MNTPPPRFRGLSRSALTWVVAAASTAVLAAGPARAATCTVTVAGDYDPATESPISGSLRACLTTANGDSQPTTIQFAITGPGSGPYTIQVKRHLPFTEAETTLDGFSQSGSAAPTSTTAAVHMIVLDGSLLDGETVLYVPGDATTIQGVRITNDAEDDPAHVITLLDADDGVVRGCTLTGNVGGIAVIGGSDNRVGGPADADRNVVVGTTGNQPSVFVSAAGPGNLIEGNTIEDSGSAGVGILDSPDVTVRDNTITGSADAGILVMLEDDTAASTIEGNAVTGGTGVGILVLAEAEQTDDLAVTGNTIGGNGDVGIVVMGARAEVTGNAISENALGVLFYSVLGEDPSPEATEDDAVGGGVLGGAGGDANTISENPGGAIFLLDTTVSNAATVEDDNTLSDNGEFVAVQAWRGLIQVLDDFLAPVEGAEVGIFGDGMDPELDDPIVEGESDEDGYVFEEDPVDPEDAETWMLVPEWVIFDESSVLTRETLPPHQVKVTIGEDERLSTYPWDGGPKLLTCRQSAGQSCLYQTLLSVPVCANPAGNILCGPVTELPGGAQAIACGSTRLYELEDQGLAAPLVIGLHGNTPSNIFQADAPITHLWQHGGGCQMNAFAARDRFIVAYPVGEVNANRARWNDCRKEDDATTSDRDDVALTDSLIARLDTITQGLERPIDLDFERIYAWGISNGGVMTYTLATLLDRVGDYELAGIAAVVANQPDDSVADPPGPPTYLDDACVDDGEPIVPASPPSVLIMHGTDDGLMPEAGGPIDEGDQGQVLSIDDTLDAWLGFNSIGATPVTSFAFRNLVPNDQAFPWWTGPLQTSTVAVETYHETPVTPETRRVSIYTVTDGAHTLPCTGAQCPEWDDLVRPAMGWRNRDISGAEEIWRFFQPPIFIERWATATTTPFGWTEDEESTGATLSVASNRLKVALTGSAPGRYAYVYEDVDPTFTFRARFTIDVEALEMDPEGSGAFRIFAALDEEDDAVFNVYLARLAGGSGGPDVVAVVTPGLVYAYPGIEDTEPQLIEVRYQAAVGSSPGYLCIERIDSATGPYGSGGYPTSQSGPLRCITASAGAASISQIRLGVLDVPSTATGDLYFDDFEAYRP